MALSMYDASVPVFIRMLGNMAVIIDKAVIYADAKKIEHTVLVNARLAPDMYPFSKQIQIATDVAKGCGARLAGIDIPSFEDNEKTFADLQARIVKTIAFLKTITAEQVNGSEDKAISVKTPSRELSFTGQSYLLNFVQPNVYFHITTAYAILRHNGMDLSKYDFLGS